MYRVRRVQIGNSGEIAWESKRAEIIPWPMELTVGGLYALRSGRLYRVEGREDHGAGETGAYGGYRTGTRMKLAQKWLELFGGYENEREDVNYMTPDFLVSDKCCYYLKEKPCNDYAKETGCFPYMGLMASEGGRRQKALMMHGCNYISAGTKRSCPFAIFSRQDLLQLALDLQVPVPEIYGEIARDADGTLRTTKAQRTGCSMCGFGIHMEKRPHRFDRLWERNPKEWEMWMNHVMQDDRGNWYGWGRVLDYIGVEWRDPEVALINAAEQITMDDAIRYLAAKAAE